MLLPLALATLTGCAVYTPIGHAPMTASIYVTPPPVYVTPRPVYVTPHPVHVMPRPVYVTPRPVVVAPRIVHVRPPERRAGRDRRDRDDDHGWQDRGRDDDDRRPGSPWRR